MTGKENEIKNDCCKDMEKVEKTRCFNNGRWTKRYERINKEEAGVGPFKRRN